MSGGRTVFSAAVGLRASDPEALTALATLRETMGEGAPSRILRFGLWEVRMQGVPSSGVEEMLRRYEDIVNPNKNTLTMLDGDLRGLPGYDPDLLWVPVRVHNRDDAASESWLSLLSGAGFAVEDLGVSVLWLLGYSKVTGPKEAQRLADEAAVTRTRTRGLLGNPVSQRITVGRAALRAGL